MDGNEYTVDTARQAADEDRLGEWVKDFLASPGSDNAALGEQLADPPRHWLGPVSLPTNQLHRLAGPPDAPVLEVVPEDEWREDVEDLADQVDDGMEVPPLVVSHKDGQLVLEDGNHRVEAMRRAGCDVAWCVVAFDSEAERDAFVAPDPAQPGIVGVE